MANVPVLVTAYTTDRQRPRKLSRIDISTGHAIPPVSSFAFADIMRSADSPDFQRAFDSIADICAKNHMSLADEYASHLPPFGEITQADSTATRQQLLRPGMRRVLTSVPEASSSSSSENGHHVEERRHILSVRKQPNSEDAPLREIRIGSMGRTVSVSATAALAAGDDSKLDFGDKSRRMNATDDDKSRHRSSRRTHNEATASLQRVLANMPVTNGT